MGSIVSSSEAKVPKPEGKVQDVDVAIVGGMAISRRTRGMRLTSLQAVQQASSQHYYYIDLVSACAF